MVESGKFVISKTESNRLQQETLNEEEPKARELRLAIREIFEPGEIFDLDMLEERLKDKGINLNNYLYAFELIIQDPQREIIPKGFDRQREKFIFLFATEQQAQEARLVEKGVIEPEQSLAVGQNETNTSISLAEPPPPVEIKQKERESLTQFQLQIYKANPHNVLLKLSAITFPGRGENILKIKEKSRIILEMQRKGWVETDTTQIMRRFKFLENENLTEDENRLLASLFPTFGTTKAFSLKEAEIESEMKHVAGLISSLIDKNKIKTSVPRKLSKNKSEATFILT